MAETAEAPKLSKRVEEALQLTDTMTALELSSYAQAMRDKYGITAAPVAVAGAPAAGGGAGGTVRGQSEVMRRVSSPSLTSVSIKSTPALTNRNRTSL